MEIFFPMMMLFLTRLTVVWYFTNWMMKPRPHCFREIYRVLKPGGKLIIGDWGKAKNRWMRTVFYTVQLLDGFKTTTANVKGLLPDYIREAGFSDVQETGFINTRIGSFCYYEGTKSLKIKNQI
ncbi:class I SAM-dependent methyltransferase [Aquiflexum balticum]|uniref:class I SAM-dependent methyltransferase n=1 Tax=Aquiflexum balticum TaxID=280473 RepID=UPI00373FDE03